jgi:F-type H+-transporting ATPase subunit c
MDIKFLSAAIAIGVTGFGGAIGIAMLGSKALESIARQPEAANTLRTTMVIAIAFVEAVVLYALVIAFMILAK